MNAFYDRPEEEKESARYDDEVESVEHNVKELGDKQDEKTVGYETLGSDDDSNEDERSSSFRDEENSSCKEGSNSLREYDDLRSLIPFKKKTEQPEIFFLFNQAQVASHSRVSDRRRVVLKERKRSDKEKPEEKKGLKRRKRRNRRRKKKPWSAAAAIARHKNSKQVTKN